MNYGEIKTRDIANGLGVRVSIFVSGCRNHCPECFQKETWDFNYGTPYTKETLDFILKELDHSFVDGLSILGGEPFEPENQPELIDLCEAVHKAYPHKDIWIYSGYTYESLVGSELLPFVDVLVDGPFIDSLKDVRLAFKGSSNQRIIDVPKSLEAGQVVLKEM